MIALVDNHDSFTYNIADALRRLGAEVEVVREKLSCDPAALVIGPGPGRPSEAAFSRRLLAEAEVPVLGICLGHQLLAEVFGGRVGHALAPTHGKPATIVHEGKGLFQGLPSPFSAIRYNSLTVVFHGELLVTARSEEGEVMGLAHPSRPFHGVQFHPESVGSECGEALFRNFLELV